MKISKVSITRPVTSLMFMLIIIVFGIVSFTKLPIDLFPQMNLPYAIVITNYDGAGPEEVESLLTKPLEQAMGTVSNIKEVTSISSAEQSMVILEFVSDTDMDFASLDIREKIDLIKGYLPDGVDEPTVMKIDPNAEAIMELGITGNYDLVELKRIIDDNIINKIERIPGVASVTLTGARESEIKITLQPEKMKGFGITLMQVSQTLMIENLNLPVGLVDYGEQSIQVKTQGEFKTIDEIKNLPIMTSKGIVYLREIADIEKSHKEMSSYSFLNGEQGINLSIEKLSTTNTVKVSNEIKKVIEELKTENEDLTFRMVYDNSFMIQSSVDSVVNAAVFGGIIALFILFIFLRNIRSTLIVGIAIPTSIVTSFILMYFFDLSLNVVSLGGLTMGIGMLVDNSIVVIENIYRHREDGLSRPESAYVGVKEVGMAVMASTFTTIAVFLPLVFVEGFIAKMFNDMSLTITFSLLASLAVAVTVVPMLASKILKMDRNGNKKKRSPVTKALDGWGNILGRIDIVYRKVLKWCIYHRKSTALIVLAVFIVTLGLGGLTGMELMPTAEENSFNMTVSMPGGTDIDTIFESVNELEEKLKEFDTVKNIFISISGANASARNIMRGGNLFGDAATFTVDLGPEKERKRSVNEIMEEIREELEGKIAGLDLSFRASEMRMSTGAPVSVQISGNDMDVLKRISEDIVSMLQDVKGTREITNSLEEGISEAVISINRNKASGYGLNMQTVASLLNNAVTGQVTTKYKVDGTEIDVRILYNPDNVETIADLGSIDIQSQTGANIKLDEIADISIEKTPSSIARKNNKRIVTIESNLFGIDTRTANAQVEEKLKNYNMPKGYSYRIGGEMEEMMDSFESIIFAILIAIVLVYMVLAAQFESLLHPFTIMFSLPLSITGAILGLFVTGMPISMPALIGLLMLVGIVVNNAIVLVDYIIQLRKQGLSKNEAILKAGSIRLRPILMTMLTTVMALVPMALGLGEGTDMMAPMAVAVIGGLFVSTMITLIIIPVIYSSFESIKKRLKKA
jgi:HAE1 family hydrophobic/amphiphilic exporter-1